MVDALKPDWVSGREGARPEQARKALLRLERILKHARAVDPSVPIEIVELAKVQLGGQGHRVQPQRALPWQQMPAVYAALGVSAADLGLKVVVLTALRTGSVAPARWGEMTEDVWLVPPERMKGRVTGDPPFRVPVSWQLNDLFRQARRHDNGSGLVFPASGKGRRPGSKRNVGHINPDSWRKRLADLGFDMVPHGVRSVFVDWALENKVCDREMAERCIAHSVDNETTRAYLRSDFLEQRRQIMAKWADFVTDQTFHETIAGRRYPDGMVETWSRADVAAEAEAEESRKQSHESVTEALKRTRFDGWEGEDTNDWIPVDRVRTDSDADS
ncbi:tyrosine-type recombinase/integrase [Rubellimicrobium arenae]|uniref:tyrosine-type recombinase/integrase n=1 Tax=Rubellimicrobium arenae TaxID=2817372 RepID=UPI001FF073BD|nr:site-specific integrase [Rubellimicrobium arenae]